MGPSAKPLVSSTPQGAPVQFTDPLQPSNVSPLTPVLEPGPLQDLKQALGMGGALEAPTVIIGLDRFKDNSLSFRGLERKLRKLGESIGTLEGEELHDAVKEIEHLETIEKQLFQLSKLKIKDPSVDAMRHDCATKLLADVNNPLGARDYKEGVNLLAALQRFAGTEEATAKERDAKRNMVASLYPGGLDSGYAFSLNSLDARDRETDPTRKPDWDSFDDLDVIKVYRKFKDSSDEGDQKVARAVEVLFAYLRDENALGSTADDMFKTSGSLEMLMDARRDAMNNPDLKVFSTRLQKMRGEKAESNPDVKVSNDVTGSLQDFDFYQQLTTDLYDFSPFVAKFPADKARDALVRGCDNFLKKGPEYVTYLRERGNLELAKILEDRLREDVLAQEGALKGLSGADLNTKNLTDAAKSLAPTASIFRTVAEMKFQDALSNKLSRVIAHVGVGDLQERLAGITEEAIEDPKERLKAYQKIAVEMDKRSIEFVVENRVKQLVEMKKPVVSFFDIFTGFGAMVPGTTPGMVSSYREVVVNPRLQQYDDMAEAYRHAAELIKSENPEDVLKGHHAFQRLEAALNASGFNDLKEGAEDAVTGNEIFMISTMVLASIAVAEVTPFLGLGARGLTAFLPIELGTQRLVATGLTYAASGLLLTGAQREVVGILMPDAAQGNFFEQWALNTAMMGVGTIGAKAGAAAFEKGLEWLALQRIAARTGTEIVVAGSSTGTAIEASVLNAEKETILQGLAARFTKTASVFGSEYSAIQVFEYVKTVGLLSAHGVKDPESVAFSHIFSLKSQGTMAGFMIVMKAHGLASVPESDSAITDAAMKIEYEAIARSLNRELPKFQSEMEAAGIQEPKDLLAHPELLQKAKTLLSHQTDLLAFKAKLNPSDTEVLGELTSVVKIRDAADPAFKFMDGVETVFGESNAFGVHPMEENSEGVATSYTYEKGNQGKIVAKLRNLPGVDAARVRILSNGLIEIPFLASEFVPEATTVRLMPASL